ncbi:MAG: winged helix-turn-helix transcriptional regulator [Thermoplasmata archaeon]
MPKRMGGALKRIVGEGAGEREEEKKRPVSVLMNRNRQRIFQFLCNFPCSHQKRIAASLELSNPTVRWHLQKLIQSGYVKSRTVGGRVVYYPAEMISGDRAIEVFYWMGNRKVNILFRTLLERQGSTIEDLAETLGGGRSRIRLGLATLERLGMIVPVIDGRYKRYFPTDEVTSIESSNRKRLRQFKRFLMKKLENDRLNPEIHMSRSREAEIQIKIGKTRSQLVIPPEPLANVIASVSVGQ